MTRWLDGPMNRSFISVIGGFDAKDEENCMTCDERRAPSPPQRAKRGAPFPPRLVKTPAAVHPLPQGGEGYKFRSTPPSVATLAKSFGGADCHFCLLTFALCLLTFSCGLAALRYTLKATCPGQCRFPRAPNAGGRSESRTGARRGRKIRPPNLPL